MTDSDFFLDDGYFETGHISALDGVHGELHFVYRPMIHADKEAYYELAKRADVAPTTAIATFVTRHLQEWSLARPIEVEQVERLRPRLLERLFYIVMGEIASDQEATDLKN
ncbi:hypothetical protein LOC68_09870 [Blastopirellula sp. JC732]|uniref:Uncharacterized protein n=1 Tax=Blastopirellula sediminis TaxID=2894196 RepID=A0A9X1SF42_9BACT|nr:hypothetical protein [Blastopirellula sediminis]MCC9608518.1 hypothetical protein [Blastopirellula sediminis]MCC9628705.1 hypothetical protein [Blastopirellula sediminis]